MRKDYQEGEVLEGTTSYTLASGEAWDDASELKLTLAIVGTLFLLLTLLTMFARAAGPPSGARATATRATMRGVAGQRGVGGQRLIEDDHVRSDDPVSCEVTAGAASPVAYSRRLPRPSAVRVAGWEDREGVTHYVIEVKEPGAASAKDVEAPTRRLHKRFNDFRGLPL